jgi:guanylate kinase
MTVENLRPHPLIVEMINKINMKTGKLIVISAPSGTGKSTIVQRLVREHPELNLVFSISHTTRLPRGTEKDGVEYFFTTQEQFKEGIRSGQFLEYEEVYDGQFYGTHRLQVEKLIEDKHNVIFDVDVKGGCSIKRFYGDRALSIFIQPPSIEELRRRLIDRKTDSPEAINTRLSKAEYELTFSGNFDKIIVNDKLEKAVQETYEVITEFMNK